MRSKVGSSSCWMIRPIRHLRKAKRCGPADASLGRSRCTRSHLRQVSSAADVIAVKNSERNSKMNSNGSIPGQPTMLTTNRRVMVEARRGRTPHKYCKENNCQEEGMLRGHIKRPGHGLLRWTALSWAT